MKWLLIIAAIITLVGSAEAKKAKVKEPEGPRRNYVNLTDATFVCGNNGCAVDVSGLGLIACTPSGCASITDVVVSTGAVKRQ